MDVRTGKLDQRVDIYTDGDIETPYGGTIIGDVLYWSTWADVEPLSSSKTLLGNKEVLSNGYVVTVRYRADKDINRSLKIVYKDRWLHLTSLTDDLKGKQYVQFIGTYVNDK